MQKMEDDDLNGIEDVWEKRFYREELKASLLLANFLLDSTDASQYSELNQLLAM